eukprot:TRINITY_DN1666_c0_g2_i1.p1 TRINITY_DN1666_c0_g2~~TRINITY_DN1666_c0_g2_i1.p1  ORF type:complete len:312 (-),score=71.12 TRINITY_DN1666_c0_g2_i1:114-1049(-)
MSCVILNQEDNEGKQEQQLPVGFLIRSHNPTDSMIDRIRQWVADLQNTRYRTWVSIDATHKDEFQAAERVREKLTAAGFQEDKDFHLHEYVESDVNQTFPHMFDFKAMQTARALCMKWRPQATVAWGFHLECISLWMKDPRVESQKLQFVWVIEDDVGCTSSIKTFLEKYAGSDADLVSKQFHEVNRAKDEDWNTGWCWFDTCTPRYVELIGGGDSDRGRYCSPEHMQRFSWQYLSKWDELMRNEVCHAWSEQGTPSLCIKLGFKFAAFAEADLGTPYSWDGKVDQDAWDEILKQQSADHSRSLIFHALKF